uniref:C-type lectin domain-containing protein n=1 Tax=Pelodiscus sinensis TaxID=13735 RepID=K7GB18_PELSI
CSSGPPAGPGCLDDWVGYRGKCYYFSEVEGNWTNSQTNCSGFRASLVVFDSEQEKVRERDGHRLNHWLGLRREQGQPWKRVNGTEFNLWFDIKGGGDCAYLSPAFVGSSRCSSHAHWICSKQDAYTAGKNVTIPV